MKKIDIRNLANIGVADINVYGGNKKFNVYPNIFVLFFRSINQSTADLPKMENQKIKYDEQYNGSFGFDTYIPKLYPVREVKTSYIINNDIKTKIGTKFLDRNEFKLKEVGDENYYISSACILKDKEIKLQIKGFLQRLRDSYTINKIFFKFVRLDDQKLPIKNSSSKFEDYPEENLKILSAQEITLSNNETFNAEINIKAMKEYDDHIGLICYYIDHEGKDVLVGQCNFSPSRKIYLPLKFIKVKVFSNGTQKYNESHTFTTDTLTDFLNNKTMGQAGIGVKIPNPTVDILKLEEIYTELNPTTNQQDIKFNLSDLIQEVDLKNKGNLEIVFKRDKILATKDDNSEKKIDSQVRKIHQIDVENKLKNSNELTAIFDKYKNNFINTSERDELIYALKNIYFETFIPFYMLEDITFIIYQKNGNWTWEKAFESNAQNSQRLKVLVSKYSLIDGTASYSTFAHELAHGLGVEHIFGPDSDNPTQPKGSTLENIMDYYTSVVNEAEKTVFTPKPYVFIRQQWDIMRAFYRTRMENENRRYDDLIGTGSTRNEFKKDCENLFSSL